INHHYAASASWHSWVPTWASIRQLSDMVQSGAAAINKYVAPVGENHPTIYIYLVLASVGILLAMDVLACGLGRVPLAGLPILLTLSIPISVLDEGLPWLVFLATTFL